MNVTLKPPKVMKITYESFKVNRVNECAIEIVNPYHKVFSLGFEWQISQKYPFK